MVPFGLFLSGALEEAREQTFGPIREADLALAGRLGEDAISEWRRPGPPIEVIDGAAMADTCVRHGVGIVNATVSVDFVDADFFAEIAEG